MERGGTSYVLLGVVAFLDGGGGDDEHDELDHDDRDDVLD